MGVLEKLSKYCKISKQEHSLQLLVVFLPGIARSALSDGITTAADQGSFFGRAQIYSFSEPPRSPKNRTLLILKTATYLRIRNFRQDNSSSINVIRSKFNMCQIPYRCLQQKPALHFETHETERRGLLRK